MLPEQLIHKRTVYFEVNVRIYLDVSAVLGHDNAQSDILKLKLREKSHLCACDGRPLFPKLPFFTLY